MCVWVVFAGHSQIELHDDPAVSQRVIKHHGIAVIIGRVGDPHQQRAQSERRGERSARFVINPDPRLVVMKKWFGPTAPFVSGGAVRPPPKNADRQSASSPSKFAIGGVTA